MTQIPCTWQGDGTGRPAQHYCRLHGGACTITTPRPALRCCATCPDHSPTSAVQPYGPPGTKPIRNLFFHVYPLYDSLWRQGVAQLLQRIDQFDGRRIIGIATGPGTVKWEEVVAEFQAVKLPIDYLLYDNNRALREVVTFEPALRLLSSFARGPRHITFLGHAKGVTHPAGHVAHEWTRVSFETCLDYPDLVNELLQRHPCAGPFKKVGKSFHNSSCGWHYSGSFGWFRNEELFHRRWDQVDQIVCGFETYLGRQFRADEAGCIFHEAAYDVMDLYQPNYWERLRDEYEAWKSKGREQWKSASTKMMPSTSGLNAAEALTATRPTAAKALN